MLKDADHFWETVAPGATWQTVYLFNLWCGPPEGIGLGGGL